MCAATLRTYALRVSAAGLGAALLTLAGGCVLITGTLNPFSNEPQPLQEHVVFGEGRDKILMLDVSKMIGSEDEEGALGIIRRESTTARVREELEMAANDDRVRAVVLRINSPGGTVTASDIIFHQLMRFKKDTGRPVVAQMLDMGTSGAYYVALAADEIVATPTTVTGSIGVVMYGVNLSGLMDKVGIRNQTIKAGALKDMGSPLRPMTPQEDTILHDVLKQMQDRFLELVRERRPGLTAEGAQTIADGRILTAEQALALNLVDRIGYLDDTLRVAGARAGVEEARVVMYRRPQEFAETIYSRGALHAPQINLVNLDFAGLGLASPQFMYMWLPSVEAAVGFPQH